MALPLSVNETAAPGSQAKSATNNDLQKSVVQKSHGSVRTFFGITNAFGMAWTGRGVVGSSNPDGPEMNINLPVGSIITAVDMHVKVASSTLIACEIVATDTTDNSTNGSTSANSGAVDGHEHVAITGGILPHTIAANERIIGRAVTTVAAAEVYGVWITYYRPIV